MKENVSIMKFFRVTCTLLLICVLGSFFTGCESQRIIVNSLDERDADEILVYLSSKGIDAVKVQAASGGAAGGGSKTIMWDISVNNNQALEAMNYLNQVGLPRRPRQNLLNIFTGSGLVPSEMEQKIRYQSGLAEQIAGTIRKMDGILDAEVQISFPPEDPLNPTQKKLPITASVFVRHNGILDDPNAHLVSKIKRLVAAAVPSLDSDNVTVVGERARINEGLTDFSSENHEEARHYFSVWGLVIAKESVTYFRIIFFSFIVLILLMVLSLIWTIWKVYPFIKSGGGFKQFLKFSPFSITHAEPSKENAENKPPEEKEKKAEENVADKDIDQT